MGGTIPWQVVLDCIRKKDEHEPVSDGVSETASSLPPRLLPPGSCLELPPSFPQKRLWPGREKLNQINPLFSKFLLVRVFSITATEIKPEQCFMRERERQSLTCLSLLCSLIHLTHWRLALEILYPGLIFGQECLQDSAVHFCCGLDMTCYPQKGSRGLSLVP